MNQRQICPSAKKSTWEGRCPHCGGQGDPCYEPGDDRPEDERWIIFWFHWCEDLSSVIRENGCIWDGITAWRETQ